jgi:hypothetical protein
VLIVKILVVWVVTPCRLVNCLYVHFWATVTKMKLIIIIKHAVKVTFRPNLRVF